MHIHFLDPYRPRRSPIHELDPRVKFVLTVAFILTVSLSPPGAWPAYILLLAIILSVEILSDLGVGYVLKRANLALPFVLAAIPLLFTTEGDPLSTFKLGPWMLTFTESGLVQFISIALKSWISVQAAIVLAASTPFPELLMAMRAVKVPRLLVAIFGLMWRYLFVLADEALRLMRARAARSGHADLPATKPGGSITWRARVTGQMAGSLFIRALERSDRIYMAMVSRGYDGEVRTLHLPVIKPTHWLILITSLSVLGMLLAFTYLLW
jgi:cobalt/nickel transport system permease protein